MASTAAASASAPAAATPSPTTPPPSSSSSSSSSSPPPSSTSSLSADAERDLRDAESDRQFSSHILNLNIEWKAFEASNLINVKDLGLIMDYDKQSVVDQQDLLAEKGSAYASLFVRCLGSLNSKDAVEYLIVLVDQMIAADPKRAAFFTDLESSRDGPTDPYAPFLRLLTTNALGFHNYILNRSAVVLSVLLSTSNNERNPNVQPFLRYIIERLSSPTATTRDIVQTLAACKPMLQREAYQSVFNDLGGVKALLDILMKESQNAQLIYSVGFNLWLLSYNRKVNPPFLQLGVIKKFVSILKNQIIEKVIRIIFATLKNLLINASDEGGGRKEKERKERNVDEKKKDEKESVDEEKERKTASLLSYDDITSDSYAEEMIGLGLIQVIDTLSKRKFKDLDILPDMNQIRSILDETIQRLSTFDVYSSEVMSGNLSWTPVHRNEVFWRENQQKFETRNYKLVSKLIELLADPDETVREVAAFDLGEFARFHPDGKKIIGRMGGKNKLMACLQSNSAKVQKAALLATQKIMVANWEFLQKSSAGGVAALVAKAKQ